MDSDLPFSVWLEQRIYERGFSKRALAEVLGVTPTTITHWTSGTTEPLPQNISRLAVLLQVTRYEIHLRLGRVEPRTEFGADWEIALSNLAESSDEYRAAVLRALRLMQELWSIRQRKYRYSFDVSLDRLFNPITMEGMRGTMKSMDVLLYYGPIHSDKGWLRLSGRLDQDSGEVTLIGHYSSEMQLAHATLQIDGVELEAQIEGGMFTFITPMVANPEKTLSLQLEFDTAN